MTVPSPSDFWAPPASWHGIKRVLIEFCTPPDSELCSSINAGPGCYCVRCTAEHDMTSLASRQALLSFVHAVPPGIPICLWSGIPCTGGSVVQNLNRRRPGHLRRMRAHHVLWTRLFESFLHIAHAVVHAGGHLVLEWPVRCRYWSEPAVLALLRLPELAWLDFRVRACAFGQLIEYGPHKGAHSTKQWRLVSTMPGLDSLLGLPCPGGHEHGRTDGAQTKASGRYPPLMAQAFHNCFRSACLATDAAHRRADVLSCFGGLDQAGML